MFSFSSLLHNFPQLLISSLSMGLLGMVVSFPAILFFGLPTYALLKKMKLLNVWTFSIIGFIGGLIAISIFTFIKYQNWNTVVEHIRLLYCFYGLSTAIVFWFITVYIPSLKGVVIEP